MPRHFRCVIRVDHPDELQEYVINRVASSFVARDRVNSSWHTSTISQEGLIYFHAPHHISAKIDLALHLLLQAIAINQQRCRKTHLQRHGFFLL